MLNRKRSTASVLAVSTSNTPPIVVARACRCGAPCTVRRTMNAYWPMPATAMAIATASVRNAQHRSIAHDAEGEAGRQQAQRNEMVAEAGGKHRARGIEVRSPARAVPPQQQRDDDRHQCRGQ